MPNSGELLKKIRSALGVGQRDFGRHIGLKWYQVRDLESGKVEISDQLSLLVALTYNVRKDFLKHGKGEMFGKLHQLMPWETEKLLNDKSDNNELIAFHIPNKAKTVMSNVFRLELLNDDIFLKILWYLCNLNAEAHKEILKNIHERLGIEGITETEKSKIRKQKK